MDFSLDPKTRAKRALYRKSILDMVREDAEKVTATVGAADRRKIDEYLYAIRDIEMRIQNAEALTGHAQIRKSPPEFDRPTGIPGAYSEHAKMMFDRQVAAFQADATRVITLYV